MKSQSKPMRFFSIVTNCCSIWAGIRSFRMIMKNCVNLSAKAEPCLLGFPSSVPRKNAISPFFDCSALQAVIVDPENPVYASRDGDRGYYPPETVKVRDTTGAGDAFCAGVAIGLTYGKSMLESVKIGTHLAASVITISESTCPRFLPQELSLDIEITD